MLEYEIAPNLKDFTHGFFKRKGGVSKGIYNSLNCGMSSKDKKDNIIKNRKMISESLNFNINKLIVANQSHSNIVKILNKFEPDINCDAMISLSNKIILGVLTADCCPILVGHKKKYMSAVIHLGWKGLFNDILENFLESLSLIIKFLLKSLPTSKLLNPMQGPNAKIKSLIFISKVLILF